MPPTKGYKHTEEHNKAISIGRKKRFAEMTEEERENRRIERKAKIELMHTLYNNYIAKKAIRK